MKIFFLITPLIALTIASCNLLPQKEFNTGIDTLNDAIFKLETNSERWRIVLEETRDKLIKEGQSTLANEVSNILSRATSDVGIEAKCYTDFLRDRTREELIQLKATITQEKLQLKPVFCNPTPKTIDLNLQPDRRRKIEIAGYNLTRSSIQVFLVNNENYMIDVSDSLDNPTRYLLTVTLSRIPINDRSVRLIFKNQNEEIASIGIIQADRPPKKEFHLSRIRITGTIDMNDDEYIVSDENKNIRVNTSVEVPIGKNKSYDWEDCVGDEVQGYLNVQMQLDQTTGAVSGQGDIRYYEGTRCGETDLQGSGSFNFKINPNESYVLNRNLQDSDGGIRYNLTFKNEYVKPVLVPQN